MEIHAHGFLLLGVFFWRGLSRILRGILRLSISGSQPLVIDLRHWPQIWRRAKKEWCIPPEQDASFVCQMEEVLDRSEEHTSELQSLAYLVCRLLLEKK